MKSQQKTNTLILLMLCAIILFFALSYIVLPTKSFSENENRLLQGVPKFTFSKLLDGTYTAQLHNYYSDQINFRSHLVEMRAFCSLALGKNEHNGILLTSDGYLIDTHHYTGENYEHLQSNLSKIETLLQSFESKGVKAYSLIVPRKIDLLEEKVAGFYSSERNKVAWGYVGKMHTPLLNTLQSAKENAFYKTDHHLSAEGTYRVYLALSEALGFEPYSIDKFDLITLTNEFFGTSYSKSGFFFTEPDKIRAPKPQGDKYQTTIVNLESFNGFYDYSYLDKKDKYATFLSGNNAHVKIEDTSEKKETVLLIKDSYAHALAPFLCEHYNIELIDPRYFRGSIEKYAEKNDIKSVIFLFGLDTLASANISIK